VKSNSQSRFPVESQIKKTFPLKAVSAMIRAPAGRLQAHVSRLCPGRGNSKKPPLTIHFRCVFQSAYRMCLHSLYVEFNSYSAPVGQQHRTKFAANRHVLITGALRSKIERIDGAPLALESAPMGIAVSPIPDPMLEEDE
jgi:hypothetical protein